MVITFLEAMKASPPPPPESVEPAFSWFRDLPDHEYYPLRFMLIEFGMYDRTHITKWWVMFIKEKS